MTLKELKSIGRELSVFLAMFAGCFASLVGRRLLRVYVQAALTGPRLKRGVVGSARRGQKAVLLCTADQS